MRTFLLNNTFHFIFLHEKVNFFLIFHLNIDDTISDTTKLLKYIITVLHRKF